ncbi:hypothetical protein D8771_27245 [Streptomyces albus]|uniref:Uncharacterized protein n=1 Tax=Streptomyces albus TaxID=1888 RepID=A0A8H1L9T3_9ACTN|nr:hypothetical protein D8771_27245 [Streptomyces albus]TXJ83017.1 hypothetical protein E2C11_08085 [Streptomyces lavendulae]
MKPTRCSSAWWSCASGARRHIGVTAGVYAHVRLRLQRQAIDTLGNALNPTDASDYPPAAAVVR